MFFLNTSKSGTSSAEYGTLTRKTLLPAFLKEPLTTFFTSSTFTAKETNVCGTLRFSKVPDIESFPPIEPVPIASWASIEPSNAAAGYPQVFSVTARPKNSWNVRRQVSVFPPMQAIFAKLERTATCAPCHADHWETRGSKP